MGENLHTNTSIFILINFISKIIKWKIQKEIKKKNFFSN